MALQRTAIGHAAVSFLVIAVIVVGGLAFVLAVNRPSRVPTTGSAQETTFYSGISSGLQLQIELNATNVSQGGALQAQVRLVNTSPESLSLLPNFNANPDIAGWDRYDAPCGLSAVDHVFGFALLQGHCTAANISEAISTVPVLLTPPAATSCPNPFYDQAYVRQIAFAPNSDEATLSANSSYSSEFKPKTIPMSEDVFTGGCSLSSYTVIGGTEISNGTTTTYGESGHLTHSCGGGSVLNGYWTKPDNGSYVFIDDRTNETVTRGLDALYKDYFHPLISTPYTIVAQDLWNQTAFAYFDVRGITLQGFSLCASNCGYPSPYLSGYIYFDGPAPPKSLQLIVNGTSQGVQSWTGTTLTNFVEWYKGGFQNPPAIKGDTYLLQFIATFEDNSTATAMTTVTAG
ncbi:MAG TPA: hypothetical protein VGR56_04475 [Nitrososphaerales archaeon]|nr:hypothetical protein [Nitrososphaerales archaeon]